VQTKKGLQLQPASHTLVVVAVETVVIAVIVVVEMVVIDVGIVGAIVVVASEHFPSASGACFGFVHFVHLPVPSSQLSHCALFSPPLQQIPSLLYPPPLQWAVSAVPLQQLTLSGQLHTLPNSFLGRHVFLQSPESPASVSHQLTWSLQMTHIPLMIRHSAWQSSPTTPPSKQKETRAV
jgi:hypothetical protein